MKITPSLALSAYVPDRFSIRSVMASLLLRTTISLPNSRKYRISVSFREQPQSCHEQNDFRAYRDGWTAT